MKQSTKLCVWNGRNINGVAILVGVDNEPISLRLELETSPEISTITISKNTTVDDDDNETWWKRQSNVGNTSNHNSPTVIHDIRRRNPVKIQ